MSAQKLSIIDQYISNPKPKKPTSNKGSKNSGSNNSSGNSNISSSNKANSLKQGNKSKIESQSNMNNFLPHHSVSARNSPNSQAR